ncbi:uncharacterized protein MONOS_11304 [Monocercomonoides exilis]|uniref:uncharacterized protein n=1 Tax=Monocercomonoides exilis TaxID=2049356 RepID=UPI00355A9F84|nr:hypothetical protein MONOS_11304 [Monocercomonoides exilis]|eukprot:MONOS_11304.1-p1 / transcript=MONOS_11304.1 / gene=MONOS_11304 / organism=Monocercomonoides_exilis_PA203 / gene_product=unspecified product / transcript_product=unspecified product / location=Mono_scaffold00560:25665-31198(-) / protein_length=1625 / sequence_SO=supercontig / SO=protein_coding / is_pseudo=false
MSDLPCIEDTAEGGKAMLSECNFFCDTGRGGVGGGITIQAFKKEITVRSCQLINCSASQGGGLEYQFQWNETEYHPEWLGNGGNERFLSSEGNDSLIACGYIDTRPCKTIEYALAHASEYVNCVTIENISLSSSPLITSVALTTEQSQIYSSNMLSNVTFSNILRKSGNGSIFSHSVESTETFSLNNFTTHKCRCNVGNGGSVYLSLKQGSKIMIGCTSMATFNESCASTDERVKGKGGGLSLVAIDDSDSFILKELSFTNCHAWKGKNLCIEGRNLSYLISNSSIGFHPSIAEGLTNFEELSGFEENDQIAYPLALWLRTFVIPAYVSGKETDNDYRRCGFLDYPCRTINGAVNEHFSTQRCKVRLMNSFSFDSEVELSSNTIDIDGSGHVVNCIVASHSHLSDENGLLVSNVSCLLSNITFALSSSIGNKTCFAECKENEMNITQCSVKMIDDSTPVKYSFVFASGGCLSLICLSIASNCGVSFLIVPMVTIFEEGKCNFDQVNLTNVMTVSSQFKNSKSGLLSGSNSELNIQDSKFTSICRNSGNGSCIQLHSTEMTDHSWVIRNCSFNGCEITGSDCGGGGLSLSLLNRTTLSLISTQFNGCSAPKAVDANGRGGGILMGMVFPTSSFDLTNLSSSLNEALLGNNIYVSSDDLKTCISCQSFAFMNKSISISFDDYVGNDLKWPSVQIPLILYLLEREDTVCISSDEFDVIVCGYSKYSCKTVNYALGQQNNREKRLSIFSGYILEEALSLEDENGIKIDGNTDAAKITMKGGLSKHMGIVMVKDKVILQSFSFVLLASLPSQSQSIFFISTETGELIVNCCSTENDLNVEGCETGLFVVASGNLILSQFFVEHITFVSHSMLNFIGNGNCLIEKSHLSGVATLLPTGLIDFSGTGSLSLKNVFITSKESNGSVVLNRDGGILTLSNCTIENHNRIEGNGGAIDGIISNDCSLIIDSLIMDNCSTNVGNGGGISVVLSGSGKFNCINTNESSNYSSCSANANTVSGGYGGAVFMKLENKGFDFCYANIAFGSDQSRNFAEKNGMNMFIEESSLPSLVTIQRLAVEIQPSEEDMNVFAGLDLQESQVVPLALFVHPWIPPSVVAGESGRDYSKCGFSWFPCSTIPFAVNAHFGESEGSIKLSSTFVFNTHIVFNSQKLTIFGDEHQTSVSVSASEANEGDGLLETLEDISFRLLMFSFSTSTSITQKCFILCLSKTLNINQCEMQVLSGKPEFSFLIVQSGTLSLQTFHLNSVEFLSFPAILMEGETSSGIFHNISISDVRTGATSGIISASKGAMLTFENSSINDSTYQYHAIIHASNVSLSINNVTLKNLIRLNGDGGAIDGHIEEGKKFDFKKCSFVNIACASSYAKGGSLLISVAKGGTFIFDKNIVEECKVPGSNGLGGGIHLTFQDKNLSYSLQNLIFSLNDAQYGKDVYLVCPMPRRLIDPLLWSGSAKQGDEYNLTMWVFDPNDPDVNMTLLRYLFSSEDDTIFVSTNEGRNTMNCGSEQVPCSDVFYGYNRLGDNKFVIHVLNVGELDGMIERTNDPLTVRGRSTNSELLIKSNGHFKLYSGSNPTTLTIVNIIFSLPEARCTFTDLIEANTGRVTVMNCVIKRKWSRHPFK